MTVLRILAGVPGIRRVGRDSDGCDVPLFEEGGQDIHYGLKRKDYIGVLEVQTVSQTVPAAQQTVSATPQTEAEANIAGKFGEEAKVGYFTCDVSSGVQVESECPFTTFMFSIAKINSKLHQGPCTTDVIGEGGGPSCECHGCKLLM